ncbi:MAG: AMP-binding protein [Pseudomonadota bacterium]
MSGSERFFDPGAPCNFATGVVDAGQGRALLHVLPDGTMREIGYDWLAERSARIANGLIARGLAPGDRVLVIMERSPDWFAAIFACMKAGLVAMPGTRLLTADDIAYRVQAAGAVAALVSADQAGKLPAGLPVFAGPSFEALGRAPDRPTGLVTRAGDEALVYFTSGTTSKPKMVPRNHAYAYAHAITARHWMGLAAGDLHWTLTDTGWAKAAWGMLFAPLLAGATVVVHEPPGPFDAQAHLEMIGRLGVTTFCAPPTVYRMFAQCALPPMPRLRRALGSGEPLNPEAMRAWSDATGVEIADGYGQTEAVCLIGNGPADPIRPGSMGKPLPGFDIAIIDEAGARLPEGEIGHIGVRLTDPWPPGLFEGYLTPDGRDRRAFRHGWYFTGDTARMDAEGYVWFAGRADDLILSAGYRISPFEVESALLEHPAVAESAVIGVPDATRGQILRAHIVPVAGRQPDAALAAEIQAHCKARTAPYMYPREIVWTEALPKTVSGKIRRAALRG